MSNNTLILTPSGNGGCVPNQDPWCPDSGPVAIENTSGFEQILENVTRGVLAPARGPNHTITVPVTGWTGTAGNSRGTYEYNDGLPPEENIGTRTGTIDPS